MKRLLYTALLLVGGFLLTGCNTDDVLDEMDVTPIVSDTDPSMNLDVTYNDYTEDYYETITDVLTITTGGTYVLEGTYNGTITINAPDEDVELVLLDATITSDSGPAIVVLDAEDVTISLPTGSISTVIDSASHPTVDDEDYNAAIYSYTDLIFNGTGTLTVNGLYNNAISSKDDIKIVDLTLNITSVDDGIIGRDYIAIKDATLSIETTGDALVSTNDETEDKGFIYVQSGTIDIVTDSDGIQVVNYVLIEDGTITIDSNDDGIQSRSLIEIQGGNISIEATEDALNSEQNILITDGNLTIFCGDDAIHGDDVVQIDGGTIDINNCYEGIEAYSIIITGGIIELNSQDDAINATIGGGQEHGPTYVSTGGNLVISGGTITITTAGDGLDANGSITMSGGSVTIIGPLTDTQASIDYDDTFTMNGGTIVAVGSNGMFLSLSDTSSQASITYVGTSSFSAGTTITITNTDNEEILSFVASIAFEAFTFSSSDLTLDETYTIELSSITETITLSETVNVIGTISDTPGGGMIQPPRR